MSAPDARNRDLTIRFGGHVAVERRVVRLRAGTLTAIVGPNGAGKTTYFNLISGQLPATSGPDVLLDGEDITSLGAGPAAARHRPGLPDHQPVPQPHRRRERAPRRAGAAATRRRPVQRCGRATATGSTRPTTTWRLVNLSDQRDTFAAPCRMATSASSRSRS
jgi:ATPase subunit of ABC transporter with duplicated ATPase domains